MAKQTLSDQVAALTAQVAALVAAQRVADALVSEITPAPAKAEAKSPAFGDRTFTEYVAARKAAAVACEIEDHAPVEVDGQIVLKCNRTFSPNSTGRTNHVARIV